MARLLIYLLVITNIEPIDYIDLTPRPEYIETKDRPDIETEYLDIYESDYQRELDAINREFAGIDFSF
jgi:hypothetical protein